MNRNKFVKDMVSILIPVYNAEKYLPDLFLSIEQQKYKKIEVIFVNDGSTDRSFDLLKEFAQKHSYVRIINQKNLGIATARNVAIQNANGEFAYMADSDDILNINSINTMIDILKRTNCDMVTSNFRYIKETTKYSDLKQKSKKNVSFKTIVNNDLICATYLKKFKSNFTRTAWNKLIKMDLVRKLTNWPYVWDKNISGGDDNYFLSQYLPVCKKVCCINDSFYFYRKQSNSITNNSFKESYFSYLSSSKYFFLLNPKKYPKTLQFAKKLQASFALWLLQRMYKSKFYNLEKIKLLNTIYWNYSSKSMVISNFQFRKLYKKVLKHLAQQKSSK